MINKFISFLIVLTLSLCVNPAAAQATPVHLYRTKGFLLAVSAILLILLILLVQLSVKLIEKRKETRMQRERLISLVIHDLRSPLRFLTMLATDLHDNRVRLSADELKERTWWIKKGAQDIYQFSEDFLLWVNSQKDGFRLAKQLFFVRPLLCEIADFFHEQALQKGNRFDLAVDEDLQIRSDPRLLAIIVRNLADNANKYTEHGCIRITAKGEAGGWRVSVSDTGKGMTEQQVRTFLTGAAPGNSAGGSQLGHQFVFDLTRQLGGKLFVESSAGKGTAVSLHIPA
ncbi:MAG TPA: HAMP domain-containing sensor histidine kinase [Puia sp.]|nr:HAMP domain-containing sensor histidine kinase [Puia sp.]